MPAICPPTTQNLPHRQHGAALMVMLVIMVIGAVTIFVTALNSSALKNARDQTTADALAKAKDALIGYAVSNLTSPGSLPCPDNNDTGSSDLLDPSSGKCPFYVGRLPWKTLGLPDLRDGSGERLWYALSPSFRDYNPSNPATSNYINSNSLGSLTVSGNTPASNVVANIFAAGPTVNGQSRSPTHQVACTTQNGASIFESLCATNYLELSNPNLNTATVPNLNYQSANTSSTFNDRLLFIQASDIIPLVETRVESELSVSLISYMQANSNTYPNPASFGCTPASACVSVTSQCIGEIPVATMNTLPLWFSPNRWFDVIYYSIGTAGGGSGTRGHGRGGRGHGGLGGGGGGSVSGSGTGCYASQLNVSGTNVNAFFLMPGTPLSTQSRTSTLGGSTAILSQYFEDAENINLDDIYVIPTTTSNDSLDSLP